MKEIVTLRIKLSNGNLILHNDDVRLCSFLPMNFTGLQLTLQSYDVKLMVVCGKY